MNIFGTIAIVLGAIGIILAMPMKLAATVSHEPEEDFSGMASVMIAVAAALGLVGINWPDAPTHLALAVWRAMGFI